MWALLARLAPARPQPRWARPPARRPGWVRAALGLLLVGCLVFLLAACLRTPGEQSLFWDAWVYDSLTLGSALVVLARAVLVRSERLAWAFLGAALACNGLGDVVYSILTATSDTEQFPSPADALYLCTNPFFYLALGLLLRARLQRFPSSAW